MKENKLTIFINKPVKEVFEYSLESDNVPKWIDSIKKEIPIERPVCLFAQNFDFAQCIIFLFLYLL